MKHTYLILLISFICILFSARSQAQLTPVVDSIPMTDGRKLAVDIYIPTTITLGPVILVQTPYNRQFYRIIGLPLQIGMNVDSSHYIFVIADWRGFYGSAAAAYAGAPSLGNDGYDCVEWIASQTWSDGNVGTWGPSALGRVQFQTATKNPPHLKCICPLVAAPTYTYNEYFPGGVLRTEYVEQLDALGFGLSPILMAHTIHDIVWTYSEYSTNYPDSILVPCFMIGGWYDHTIEQMLPFFNGLRTLSPANVRDKHRLLMGPWVHGGHGISQVGSSVQGELSYPNATHWNDSLALLFFDYHLRTISNNWNLTPFVQYYQMGENVWQNSTAWPPTGPVNTNFYFHHNNDLNIYSPTNSGDSLSLNYDPNNPSPTNGGPTLRTDLNQGPYDQASLIESRNDILIFTTGVIPQDIVMKGNAVVHLKISSNKSDTDFDIRLTDVYPDGRSMIVNDGTLRMRFRNGNTATDTAAMIPGQIYDAVITLPNTAITFLAGHKIRVDVTSSNYPRFNRNMNTDGPMYPGNSMDSLINPAIANNTVYMNTVNFSYITLPLVGFDGIETANSLSDKIHVFPNPILQVVHFSGVSEINEIILRDIFGRELKRFSLNHGDYFLFDVSEYSSGIYLVEFVSQNGMISKKLVKY